MRHVYLLLLLLFIPFASLAAANTPAYDTIILTQPKDQETLQNTGGELSISIETPLQKDHKWRVLWDGKEMGELQTTNQFTLKNIERGEHTLQIQAVDANNTVIASSDTLTLYIHQAVISQP